MAVNVKCPKCGSTNVQLSSESSKHGCIYMVLFEVFYFCWIMIKWMIGACIFVFYDWWMAIVHAVLKKGMSGSQNGGFQIAEESIIATTADTISKLRKREIAEMAISFCRLKRFPTGIDTCNGSDAFSPPPLEGRGRHETYTLSEIFRGVWWLQTVRGEAEFL